MKKEMKLLMYFLVAVFSLVIIVGCSNTANNVPEDDKTKNGTSNDASNDSSEKPKDEEEEPEEITLIWAYQGNEEQYYEDVGKYIEEKFPHITIEAYDAGTDHPETLEQ